MFRHYFVLKGTNDALVYRVLLGETLTAENLYSLNDALYTKEFITKLHQSLKGMLTVSVILLCEL